MLYRSPHVWEMCNNDNIFGSPTEPIFNFKDFSLQEELLEESLYTLVDQNEKQIEQCSNYEGLFKEGKTAEYVFMLCSQLKLMPNTSYTAIELFDRFMATHISGLYDIVRSSSSKDKESDWKTVEERLKEQLPLRIVSCVQIASKLVSHRKALTPSQVRRFLLSNGYNYSISSVIKSELRILMSLQFKVMVTTPLVFIETLLEILGCNAKRLNVKILHTVGIKLLDVYYIKRRNIYLQLCEIVLPQTVDISQTTAVIGRDYLLLASAIVVAAAFMVDPENTARVMDLVHDITQISKENIEDFARVITSEALEPSPLVFCVD